MEELRDVRRFVANALNNKGFLGWIYETGAGARPESTLETSLKEVEAADIYVGLFWKELGEITAREYLRAVSLRKPIFVYIRDKERVRSPELEAFLGREILDPRKGVTYSYFDDPVKLSDQVSEDIMDWLVRRHKEMTAEIDSARISRREIERLKAEVSRFEAASQEKLSRGTEIDILAQNLRRWFETLGYRFEKRDHWKQFFRWIINIPTRRGYERVVVHGVSREGELSDLKTLHEAVVHARADEGWLVANQRISQAVRDATRHGVNNLFCYTFDELLEVHADFTRYFDWLENEVKSRGISRLYVPIACTKKEYDPETKRQLGQSRYDQRNGWTDGYIDRWLDDPSKEHISILGEFGTGKTWVAIHYASKALQKYRESKDMGLKRPRIPILIPLRDYAKAVSVESLFSEFFFRKHEIPLPGYSAFEELNRIGKLLLIFDGFDEMASRVDRQSIINNFWELAKVVVPGSKVILTCRSEHFPEAKESRSLLSAELRASTAELSGEPPQFEILELEKFDKDQISRALSLRVSSDKVDRVMNLPQLLDLTRRPIMIDFVLEALPDIELGKPVDLSHVYLYAVRRKIESDIAARRTFTSLADKLYFLCELSWEMLSTERMSINYRLFPDRIRNLFGDSVKEQKDLDHWQYDMMGQSLLVRNSEGDYSPAHRSLLEFFTAYRFAAQLGVLAPDFTELAKEQSSVDGSAAPECYSWSKYFRRETRDGTVVPIVPLKEFKVEEFRELVESIGKLPFTRATIELMENMLSRHDTVDASLLAIIQKTRDKPSNETGMVGGNIATLLVNRNIDALKSRDLSGTKLQYADFGNADLTDCKLINCDLHYTKFRGSKLENVDMSGADLTGAQFAEMGGVNAIALCPGGSMFATGGGDTNLHVWDTATGTEVFTFRGHSAPIRAVCWSQDGKYLASADGETLLLWKLSSERAVAKVPLEATGTRIRRLIPMADKILCVSQTGTRLLQLRGDCVDFSSELRLPNSADASLVDEETLTVAFADTLGVIVEWNLSEGTELRRVNLRETSVGTMTYSATSGLLASCADLGVVEVVKFPEVRRILSLKAEGLPFGPTASDTIAMEFSPNGNLLAIGNSGGLLIIVDCVEGRRIHSQPAHTEAISAITFAQNGDLVISASRDRTIKFWDARPFVKARSESEKDRLPEWWLECKVRPSPGLVPNTGFLGCLRSIEQTLNCRGMIVHGCRGLDVAVNQAAGPPVSLREWLVRRGAVA
jgi:hypothetical protein